MDREFTPLPFLDEIARRRFESAWRAGHPEPIESLLPPPDDPKYLATLEELVHIELEFTWKSRQSSADGKVPGALRSVTIEEYLVRFPRLNEPSVLLRLLQQEHLVRQQFGDRPCVDDYRRRFPDLVLAGRKLEDVLPSIQPEARASIAEPEPGTRLGQYRLRLEHARGGFGLVWRAEDEVLGREVALKQLSGILVADDDYRRRFVGEARIAAQLQHPGIVPVYSLGDEDGENPYYTMKLVSGQTLGEAIRRFHTEPREAGERALEHLRLLNSFLAVARAMAYAHSRGVIHRDLKPDNILLGDYGETVILDWGLAKVLAKGAAAETAAPAPVSSPSAADATQFGTLVGTPAYLSPEQAAGQIEDVDERSDIYCLGTVLYHLLTGRPPFRGASPGEVVELVRTSRPPRPRAIAPAIPRPLEAICMRAMAPRPAERYPDAGLLARDLERYLADEPVGAYREGMLERLGRWARRHRTGVVSGSISLLLILLAAVAGLVLWQRELQRRDQELLSLQRAAEGSEKAALNELHAGQFVSALTLVQRALEPLEGKPEVGQLKERLEARRDEMYRLVEFYRLSDEAERLAFLEYDDEATDAFEEALAHLQVFQHKGEWPNTLPAADLTPIQLQQLQRDAYRTLLYLSGLRGKRGLVGAHDPERRATYAAAIEAAELAHRFHQSQSGGLVQLFCNWQLGRPLQVPSLRDPNDAADSFFMGMLHFWMAQAAADDPVNRLAQGFLLGPLCRLDFKTPMATSEQLLRTAADLEPKHYWTHLWRGWRYLGAKNPLAAELCFSTCIVLRPNYALGYAERGQAIIEQTRTTTSAEQKEQLERRGLQDFDRAHSHEPNEPWIHWLHAMSLGTLQRSREALRVCGTALELEQPLQVWRGRRIEAEKKAIFASAIELANKRIAADRRNPEAYAVRALAHLVLEADDRAKTDATTALELSPGDDRALTVRGSVYLHQHQPGRALEDFKAALGQTPRNYRAAAGRAEAYRALGQYADALDSLNYVVKIAVADWQRIQAHEGRARLLHRLGRDEEASEACDDVRLINSKRGDALVLELFPGR
jgi:eukaryotic-like serine/threonine-protein kinase